VGGEVKNSEDVVESFDEMCGQVTVNCSTCAHSEFLSKDRHSCLFMGEVDSDDVCASWHPLHIAGQCAFGCRCRMRDVS